MNKLAITVFGNTSALKFVRKIILGPVDFKNTVDSNQDVLRLTAKTKIKKIKDIRKLKGEVEQCRSDIVALKKENKVNISQIVQIQLEEQDELYSEVNKPKLSLQEVLEMSLLMSKII